MSGAALIQNELFLTWFNYVYIAPGVKQNGGNLTRGRLHKLSTGYQHSFDREFTAGFSSFISGIKSTFISAVFQQDLDSRFNKLSTLISSAADVKNVKKCLQT